MNPFQEKYRSNWLRVIEEEPLISIRSRMAQRILKQWRVDVIRHKEVEMRKFPRKYINNLKIFLP